MCPFPSVARIDAAAGLQIAQPKPLAVPADQLAELADPGRLDDLEQLGARLREVLAQGLRLLDTARRQQLAEHRDTRNRRRSRRGCGP